jgi:hypothetical protein
MATATITGNLREIFGTGYTGPVLLINRSAPLFDDSNYIVGITYYLTPDSSGNFTTALSPGNYRMTIPGQKTATNFTVPDGGGTYNLSELVDDAPFTASAPYLVPVATDTVYGKVIIDRATGTAATTAFVLENIPDLSSRVAKAGDQMTGPLTVPQFASTGSVSATQMQVGNGTNQYGETFGVYEGFSNFNGLRLSGSTSNSIYSDSDIGITTANNNEISLNQFPHTRLKVTSTGSVSISGDLGAANITTGVLASGSNYVAGIASAGSISTNGTLSVGSILNVNATNKTVILNATSSPYTTYGYIWYANGASAWNGNIFVVNGNRVYATTLGSRATGQALTLDSDTGKDIEFLVNGAANYEAVRIKSSGKVGIGTDEPTATLEVNGSIAVSTELLVGGALNHDGAAVGFYGASPAAKPAQATGPDNTDVTSYTALSGGYGANTDTEWSNTMVVIRNLQLRVSELEAHLHTLGLRSYIAP